MGIVSKLKFSGLQLANNEFSAAADGALVEATNVVIQGRDTLEPRRGQFSRPFYELDAVPNEIFYYRTSLLTHYGTGSLALDNGSSFVPYNDGAEVPSETNFEPPDITLLRTKGVEANRNFYFTTSLGVRYIDGPTNFTAPMAGLKRAADIFEVVPTNSSFPVVPGTAVGWEKRVSYRVLFGRKDDNGTLHLSSPSGRFVATNENPFWGEITNDMRVTFPIPVDATTELFYRLYRTVSVDLVDTAGNYIDPGDEHYLVKEAYFTQAEIDFALGGSGFQVIDTTPDGFLGIALYTNPNTGEGVLQANDPPPLCKDMAYWNNRMWYANTTAPHRQSLTFISAPRTGDVITVDGFTFIWSPPSSDIPSDPLYTAVIREEGNTVAEQLEFGARNLVNAINDPDSNTGLVAYYISLPDEAPGTLLIERTSPVAAGFTTSYATSLNSVSSLTRVSDVTSAKYYFGGSIDGAYYYEGDVFDLTVTGTPDTNFPAFTGKTVTGAFGGSDGGGNFYVIEYSDPGDDATFTPGAGTYRTQRTSPVADHSPKLSGSGVTSEQEIVEQRVYFSKLQQPEAVPPLNYMDVGQPGRQILRIVPLRDKLYVFKPEGIFIISGEAPFRVDLLDDTVRLLAADSAVAVSNQIHCLTNQGVCAVSDGGVAIVSGPVEPEIRRLLRDGFLAASAKDIFGVSHESDHLYTLWVPEEEGEQPTLAWVYNTSNGTWVNWELPRRCGRVNPNDDILHMGVHSPTNNLARERKDYTNGDFADEQFEPGEATYVTSDGTITWPDPVDVQVGDFLTDVGVFGNALVTAVVSDSSPYVVEVLVSAEPSPGGYETDPTVYKAFASTVTWKTIDAGDPTQTKQFRDINVHFRAKGDHRLYTLTFATDQSPAESSLPVTTPNYTVPAEFTEWGPYRRPEHERLLVPQEMQRAAYFHVTYSVEEAVADWSLNGISLTAEMNSERNKK